MGIKSIFFGRNSNSGSGSGSDNNNNNNNSGSNSIKLQAAKPYHTILPSHPPVKGSYPVAGNGPNVLEQIQRTRARRQSLSSAAPAPNIARYREDPNSIQRPRTAPHDGSPGGGHISSQSTTSTKRRTLSGFSMKSPPSIFSGSRRNSIRSSIEHHHPLPLNPTPASIPPPRDIRTYIPTNGNTNSTSISSTPVTFTPPFAQQQHHRASSQSSHKSYVDLLDAHSNIRQTREASLHRYKASGVRNYGEDVADRNISLFGEKDPSLDLNSPEFSYLRKVYAPKKGIAGEEPHSRASSALGHVLVPDYDDSIQRGQPRTKSMGSTSSGPRPLSTHPPRVDSVSAGSASYGNGRNRDDRHSTLSNSAVDPRGRPISKLSSSTVSVDEELLPRSHKPRQFVNSTRALSTPPISEREQARAIAATTGTTNTSSTTTSKSNPPPVPPPGILSSYSHIRQPGATATVSSSSKTKGRGMSATSLRTAVPPATNGVTSSRKSSVGFVAFSPEEPQTFVPSSASRQKRMIVEGASHPPSLDGIVDLKDSVDTDVTTKQLPAVVHEHVIPHEHQIREEVITREIHTHDVYHRVLPVIETEILPTKHYVRAPDGKTLIAIPESEIPKHKVTGRLDQNWHLSQPEPNLLSTGTRVCETASRGSTDSAPDGPVIGLARGEPRSHARGNSKASTKSFSKGEPMLSSKNKFITKDGIPRTEYIWRHPPVFETVTGETQPVSTDAGLHAISHDNYYSDEDDELRAARTPTKGEEDLLFRDSGYGSGGMLPGLMDQDPSSNSNGGTSAGRMLDEATIGRTKVPSDADGEATKALWRIRERRRSSATARANGHTDLEDGVRNLNLQ